MAHGHRRIAFLGDRAGIPTADQRHVGYLAALDAARIRLGPKLVIREVTGIPAAEERTVALLSLARPPTALFTAQNLITVGAIRGLGLQTDVALVGFDDFLLADLIDPAVTVVSQDPAELGLRAVARLFTRMDGDDTPARVEVVRTQLIQRGSGEIPPPRLRRPGKRE